MIKLRWGLLADFVKVNLLIPMIPCHDKRSENPTEEEPRLTIK